MKKIELPPLKEALPKIRAAFEAGELQAQINQAEGIAPQYSGPCAIGVLMSGIDQSRLDRGIDGQYGIETLIRENHVKASDSPADFGKLQYAHDNWLRHPAQPLAKEYFVTVLTELETRYGATSPA